MSNNSPINFGLRSSFVSAAASMEAANTRQQITEVLSSLARIQLQLAELSSKSTSAANDAKIANDKIESLSSFSSRLASLEAKVDAILAALPAETVKAEER